MCVGNVIATLFTKCNENEQVCLEFHVNFHFAAPLYQWTLPHHPQNKYCNDS